MNHPPPVHLSANSESSSSFAGKWWTYQRERFPVVAHGVLIAAFSFCAVSLSRALRGQPGWPGLRASVVAFATCFIYFLQLRIADEFKDIDEDSRYRPYRPVPRGLVTLRELGVLFAVGSALQLILALWLDPRGVWLLVITWTYLAAMSKEFFVADWLRRRHLLYMLSHMVIMPLVDLYATSTDWLAVSGRPPRGLSFFLAASFCNGLAIEIGRKIRSPQDEEAGVATYSHLWGRPRAVAAWWMVMVATFTCACIVAIRLHILGTLASILGCVLVGAVIVGALFLRHSAGGRGKWIERYSGLWTLALYLSLGLLPHWIGRGGI